MARITDFPFLRATLEQLDFGAVLPDVEVRKAEDFAEKISHFCVQQNVTNLEVMLGLFLYMDQVTEVFARNAGIKPKSRIA
jgi:hypothetical protein